MQIYQILFGGTLTKRTSWQVEICHAQYLDITIHPLRCPTSNHTWYWTKVQLHPVQLMVRYIVLSMISAYLIELEEPRQILEKIDQTMFRSVVVVCTSTMR